MSDESDKMRRKPAYRAAQAVAATVEAHFARHLAAARASGAQELAPAPDAQTIEAIIDATFWASLRREEGRSPKISLSFLPLEQAGEPLVLAQQLKLTPEGLTKLAPAVERPGIHLGVWRERGELRLWGTTRDIPSFCFVAEVVEPGLLVIKHRRLDGFGKFANVVVLQGEQIKVMDEEGASLPDCPALLESMLSFNAPAAEDDPANALVQLAVSMRAHGRGGSLLVVPAGSEGWQESILHPIPYAVAPAFSGLAALLRQEVDEENRPHWVEALHRTIDGIAGLTAVDGATIINDQYELLAFGAKITRAGRSAPVERMALTEPVVGNRAVFTHPAQNGGTRHLSAAQFAHDQHDALALVASQDGRFTLFAWSPCEEMVHAHRVDTLLL